MSNHGNRGVAPMLIQAFEAFNRSAGKLSAAYRQLKSDIQEGRQCDTEDSEQRAKGKELRAKNGEQEALSSPITDHSSLITVSASPRLSIPVASMLTAIGDIIVNIAHRMRSPLGAIQLFAELLKQDLTASVPDKQIRTQDVVSVLDDILVGVHSLDAVLCNLLSFAQPVTPRFQEVDLVAVLDESLLFAAPAIKQQNISLYWMLDTGRWMLVETEAPDKHPISSVEHRQLYCRGDLEQLKQVCFNLILNAIQAMPEGGELRINASYSGDGKYVNVEIEDNGCGIPDEHMERIFTPFFTTKEGGAGLGLCVIYRVVQAHQGSIEISSNSGCGTAVCIQLPT